MGGYGTPSGCPLAACGLGSGLGLEWWPAAIWTDRTWEGVEVRGFGGRRRRRRRCNGLDAWEGGVVGGDSCSCWGGGVGVEVGDGDARGIGAGAL